MFINAQRIFVVRLFLIKQTLRIAEIQKVADVYNELKQHCLVVDCFDPLVDTKKVSKDYGISIIHSKEEVQTDYDLVVQLVNHNVFNEMGFADATFIKLKDLL